MTSKKLAIVLVLFFFSVSLLGQATGSYPATKGPVSDYAGKLSEAQIKELTSLIQQYEQKTSIEFAVVVVDSLHGRSARDYATGLGESWGVGKAGRNNGVVLLWAPNERAYSLRIADGLTPELSDSDARLLTQQHLVPYFKRGDYYAGLKETVQTTMAYLGDQAWEERIQARVQTGEQQRQREAQAAQAAEQEAEARRRQEQAQAEETAHNTRVIIVFLLIGTGVGLGIFTIRKLEQGQRKRAELSDANQTIADLLSKAESNAPQIQKLLDDFSKEAPEQDLRELRSNLAGQPDRITKIKLDATLLDPTKLESYDEVMAVKSRAETEAGLLANTQLQTGSIRVAKQQSQALIAQLSKENFQISDVRDSAKRNQVDQLLLQSQQNYQQARQNSSTSVFDWLIIHDLLTRSQTQVQQAVTYSQAEPYVPSFSSSTGSESSGSSFGSFSGGSDSGSSSGGGGGFSGGSGSDGSY